MALEILNLSTTFCAFVGLLGNNFDALGLDSERCRQSDPPISVSNVSLSNDDGNSEKIFHTR